ncbi:hypothetical protein L1987_14950 [Smallanthus sonchifolius]|uniref:Uncharacterized protein n=1 Tax=Smallanthus sonchifolius TaxID=185202 RepID=A0ACB9J4A3_9ASTR|nr:hypothetical protein L1987_14950 [Smallanthus sonchifolius]
MLSSLLIRRSFQTLISKSIKTVQFWVITASWNKHELVLPNATKIEGTENHQFHNRPSSHQLINNRSLFW